jgi:N-acetylglucosaminyldiphosphoundecaprenol N-acetyl-beta-D-mannosaminyltransferase
VADASIDDVADAVLAAASEESSAWRCVVTPNVDHLVRYRKHPIERTTAQHATMVLPDGMPIVWASRVLRRPLRERLTGADLFAALWPRLCADAVPTVVVASSDVVAERMQAAHPAVTCIVPPMFDVTDDAAVTALVEQIDDAVRRTGARVLVIGVSMPKHHLLAHRLRERWAGGDEPRPVVLLLGASPDFALGLTPRAPAWMRRIGLEWLHRLALDPRRMAKRYLVDDVAFVRIVVQEWRRHRRAT